MSSSNITVKGGVNGVKETIDVLFKSKEKVWTKLLAAMEQSGSELAGAQLSGARSQLKEKTGNLFRGILYRVRTKGDNVILKAGALKKANHARFFEKGVMRLGVEVRPVRRDKSRDRYGIRVKSQTKKRTNIRFELMEAGIKFIKPYKRDFILKPRPFIIPAYEAQRATIEARIDNAVSEGTADGH